MDAYESQPAGLPERGYYESGSDGSDYMVPLALGTSAAVTGAVLGDRFHGVLKTAPPSDPRTRLSTAEKDALHARLTAFKNRLNTEGVHAGMQHKRILIPKNELSTDDLLHLGFQPGLIAVPEPGQKSWYSFRHTDSNHHLHDHGDYWTMHEDAHPSMTMAVQKAPTLGAKAQAMGGGLAHVLTEGVPSLFINVANSSKGVTGPLVDRIRAAMGSGVKLSSYGYGAAAAGASLGLPLR